MNDKLIQRTGYNAVGNCAIRYSMVWTASAPGANDRVFRAKLFGEVESPKDNRWYYWSMCPSSTLTAAFPNKRSSTTSRIETRRGRTQT